MYYVNTNNTLSALTYDVDYGAVGGDAFNGSTAIKSDSRCITAATVRKSANDETIYTLLFFEAPSGDMTFFYGRKTPQAEWEWQDMSQVLDTAAWREPSDVRASLGCPCTSNSLQTGNDTSPTNVEAAFFNPEFLTNASAPLAIGLDFSNATEAGVQIFAKLLDTDDHSD